VASLSLTGGSRGDLEALTAKEVTVDVSGGSNVTITASDEVNRTATGGSHITVIGNPKLNVQSSGGA
jgi:putative autotransporter adhesin-like protein